ncbi:hypothetical protein CO726_29920 [Bacillus fungorum]|uniref:Uncharacterized protein n=1 Tax=Bacillus fungorum TaxID=2039284 RepID=A0A2G6Q4W4_9BACI|nr:hypothetical protein [Bacillus fungorum]PIE91842.1 hypothetical protein CO726_29920 [Bacillus fungorum]
MQSSINFESYTESWSYILLWLGFLIGYLVSALCLVFLIYKIGQMNKAEGRWYQINFIKESTKKEAAQLKEIKNDGKKAQ